jgi:DNA-binding MarR family transcriptional regulator
MDHVDEIVAQWQQQRGDLDYSPMLVIGRLSRTARLIEKQLERCFAEFGLQQWEFDVLATLRRAGDPYELTPTQIVGSLMVSTSAMTNRVDRLEKAGLVTRSHDLHGDRRAIRVRLTPAGLTLVDRAVEAHVANEKRLLEDLTPTQRTQLAALLAKLSRSAETTPAPPAARKTRTPRNGHHPTPKPTP